MAEPTATERGNDGAAELAAAARERGMEQLESAKSELAEGAERVAAAVERTAEELEGGGDESLSGFGRSAATLMRQLAGGLRERDVEGFARELAGLARRNPGLFLAGSVALGFGMARVFKARPAGTYSREYGSSDAGWRRSPDTEWRGSPDSEWRDSGRGAGELPGDSGAGRYESAGGGFGELEDYDPEDGIDLSAGSPRSGSDELDVGAGGGDRIAERGTTRDEEQRARNRRSGKQRARPQRASAAGPAEPGAQAPSTEPPSTDRVGGGDPADSAFTGGTGGGAMRGGKS